MGKATRPWTLLGESTGDAAESEALRMRGTFLHGNRENPKISSAEARLSPIGVGPDGASVGRQGAVGQGVCRTADVNVFGGSDGLVVPEKPVNKASPTVAAESVEGRGSTKGNVSQTTTDRTQRRSPVSRGLGGVREAVSPSLTRGKSRMR
jgi:hypothetical protein